MNWNKKKIWLSCLGFLFYIFWIKMPNLLWKFSFFLSNSVGYILCPPSSPRFPQSLAFTCTVCILWGSSSLLHYCVLTNTENSVNIKAFYFKSCPPFWWWCWIFKHLPVWQLCNFLVGTNFYYIFLSLVPVFSADFPICLFEGSLFTELAGFFSFLVPSILVSHVLKWPLKKNQMEDKVENYSNS